LDAEGLTRIESLAEKAMVQGKRALFILKEQGQVNAVLDLVRARKATLISLMPQRGSLEDLFMREVQDQHRGGLPQ